MAKHDNQTSADSKQRASNSRPLSIFYNGLSVAGCVATAFGTGVIGFLFVLPVLKPDPAAYAAFTFVPAVVVTFVGLVLILAGIGREKWRRAHGRESKVRAHWALNLDLDTFKDTRVAAAFLCAVAAVTFGVFSLGAASLRGLQYAESNAFCGTVCHEVMQPEATVYENSPHARIECVECHVGHGRGTFLRAKVNGLRQAFLYLNGDITRPIPTPLHDQRPSRVMCETCHWTERWIHYKSLAHPYFIADEKNTPRSVRMEIKIGGGTDETFRSSGIHYHMQGARKVEFIARDTQRQDIPWVRVTDLDGFVTEFNHAENPLSDSEKETLETHTMECLDCHNRPAHQFMSPVDSVNQALVARKISAHIPYIKRESVRGLDGSYASTEEAMAGIADSLRAFYQQNYPKVVGSKRLEEAIEVLQTIYRNTIFPEMKADWSAHPDNIGHRDSLGCFRCHNYEMESEEGDTIFKDCATCHSIVGQIEPAAAMVEREGLMPEEARPFLHPDGDEYLREQTTCSDCHDGGFRVYKKQEEPRKASLEPRPHRESDAGPS